jgi:hypothetical protein
MSSRGGCLEVKETSSVVWPTGPDSSEVAGIGPFEVGPA